MHCAKFSISCALFLKLSTYKAVIHIYIKYAIDNTSYDMIIQAMDAGL